MIRSCKLYHGYIRYVVRNMLRCMVHVTCENNNQNYCGMGMLWIYSFRIFFQAIFFGRSFLCILRSLYDMLHIICIPRYSIQHTLYCMSHNIYCIRYNESSRFDDSAAKTLLQSAWSPFWRVGTNLV